MTDPNVLRMQAAGACEMRAIGDLYKLASKSLTTPVDAYRLLELAADVVKFQASRKVFEDIVNSEAKKP